VKLPAHRAGLPGKETFIYIVPLDPVYKTGLAGHAPVTFTDRPHNTKVAMPNAATHAVIIENPIEMTGSFGRHSNRLLPTLSFPFSKSNSHSKSQIRADMGKADKKQ
jgi:hypothetical protein